MAEQNLDKNEVAQELTRFEEKLADMYALTGQLETVLNQAISENKELMLENERLRFRMADLMAKEDKELAPSDALMQVYKDGFHICHTYYGKKLEVDENCLLCQDVLYR